MSVGRGGRSHATAPNVRFADGADRSALNQLDHAAVVVGGMDLRAHLRGQLALAGLVLLLHDASFIHRVGQRLLAIHAQAAIHGPHARRRVGVIGRAHNHRVQVFLLDQLAPVGIGLGPRVFGRGRTQVLRVDVAQRDDVLLADPFQVGPAAAG